MANCMAEVAKALGVELEEDFRIKGIRSDLLFRITEGGVFAHYPGSEYGELNKLMLAPLLTGESEVIKLPWKPQEDEKYYVPCININPVHMYDEYYWNNDDIDIGYYRMGLVCKTSEEAIAMIKKMIAMIQEEKKNEQLHD